MSQQQPVNPFGRIYPEIDPDSPPQIQNLRIGETQQPRLVGRGPDEWLLQKAYGQAATERVNIMTESVAQEVNMIGHKIDEIKQTVCPECGGFGHTRKKCATYKRLIGLTKGLNGARVVMNAARTIVTGLSSKTLKGKRMQWH